jgi:amino acid adenylation domain-containing protein
VTLADLLRHASEAPHPGKLTRVGSDGAEVVLGYAEVRDRAERVLNGLRAHGARPGDEVVLQVAAADEFAPALWACILGGFTAVPVGPAGSAGQAAQRLREVWTLLDRPLVLAGSGHAEPTQTALGGEARVMRVAELAGYEPDTAWHPSPPDAVAVLLLSSGTTGRPKLIQRTHANLLGICQGSIAFSGFDQRPITFLNWLPLDHNAGLTSCLTLVAAGAHQIHLGTHDVLADPERWLHALHRYRATHTGTTNYALALVNERLAAGGERGWDLSHVERVTVTAEPVVARTVRTFVRNVARYGLRPEALCTSYGMSEVGGIARATAVRLDEDGDGDAFLAVGAPVPGISLRVVDAQGQPVDEGCEGRIQVRGDTVTPGYSRDPDQTRESFSGDGWFETGDAGFLRGGSLSITGREKDVLIVNGLNIPSQEIEAAVEEVDGVTRGCTAVCSVRLPGGATDSAAVFLHTPLLGAAERDALRREVRSVVAARFGATVARVLLVRRDDLPRTPLGKIRRPELRRALQSGRFAAAVAEDAGAAPDEGGEAPRTELEREICAVWAEVLGVPRVGIHDDFLGLGGHSLLAARVAARVRAVSGVEVPLRLLFEHPTVAALAAAVEAMPRGGAAVQAPSAAPMREGPLPLSTAQQRLWLAEEVNPGTAVYNLSRALRLRGGLDVAVLERALGEVVRRHEALRTVFRAGEDGPVQVLAPMGAWALPVEDLSAWSGAAREAEVVRRAGEHAAEPFDLARGPLFRATLLRLWDEEHVLLLGMHHIIGDGWSIGVLFREVEALYGAFRRGEPSPLPPLPLQFGDHAVRQRAAVQGQVMDRQMAYWRERLADTPALLELPTDRPRPPVQSHRGGVFRFVLPRELSGRVAALGRAEEATLFMTLLAAFQVVLAKHSGQDDLVVGTPVAGRGDVELDGLIGFFVNTLALRTDLSGDPTFRELLRRVRQGALGAFANQELPFDRVVEELQPARSLGHSPLFQVSLALQNAGGAPPRLPGLETLPLRTDGAAAMFDLSLNLAEEDGALRGWLEYAADLFDPATAQRMVAHLQRVLEGVTAAPETRLSRLELLDDAGRRRVLEEWNQTAAPYPAEQCIHHLFEAQVERTPAAVAVSDEEQSVTYAQLNERANRLAHRLRRMGVGPEVRVGICMRRGVDLVVSILAVLKAGGAYVPLDPSSPEARLRHMLAHSGATVLLTQQALRGELPVPDGVQVVAVDEDGPETADGDAWNPEGGATPGSLAYVIFTSGSTGLPKGVGIEHGALVSHMTWFIRDFALTAADRVLQKTPVVFDASVWEFYAPLLVGGELVMARHEGERDPAYLARTLRGRGITTLQLVPSLFRVLLDEPDLAACTSLRHLFCGGEALPGELCGRLAEVLPQARLVNLYGPAECCIDTSTHICACEDADAAVVPIGRPVTNTRSYVLDAAMRPLPEGIPGELYIGGVQVGRGYLGRPELTAERFLPDPFGGQAGARLYRTGDRARWRADGTLEYLGRADTQVKVRGIRIEPGEIAAVLRRHPGMRECVVVAREESAGDTRLVAYVAGDADADTLRAHLRESLPEYMVPTAFVALQALPLNSSGKVDRRALPAPEYAAAADASVAPRTPVEGVLAGIWAQVLRLERVGVHENFFELGGHSLLATRVTSRIREALQVEPPLRALFEAPTVAGLAERVEALRRAELPPLSAVVPVERDGPLPLSFAQDRLWFLYSLEPESPFYNIPTALRLTGALDVGALERAVGEIVRRHEALRTTFQERGGQVVQVIVPFSGFTVAVEDVAGADEAEVRRRAAQDAARPFDLATGPLFRATLLRRGPEEQVLLLCLHHIIGDGWSMGVLFRELSALYEAYREGRDSPLPELPVQYADYAVWQRRALRGERLDRHLAYWRERLAAAPALLELPTDRARPAVQSYRGASERFEIPANLVQRLQARGRAEGATLYMVLLAAFQLLLSRYAGTDDVVVGSPTAGRVRAELEDLVGFFINTLVLRTDLSGDPDFREVLRRVREVTLSAYEHQEVPFERVVEEVHPERSLSRTPLFQVMFVLQNAARAVFGLEGVRAAPLGVETTTAKFDLTLTLAETPQGLSGWLEYATDLFDPATAARMRWHLRVLLEAIASDPGRPVSELPLLDGDERRRVLAEWNATGRAYPRRQCIHHLFEQQAGRTPGAVALRFGGESFTYAELNRRANRLAHHLRRLGVGPEVRVGIMVERSVELLVGLLAILKTGGAYVPLEPGYPAERLLYVLQDSRVPVLLTQERLLDRVPEHGARVVVLDREPQAGESTENPCVPVEPRNLAYVMYTSGSTGRPKGVATPHGAVVRLVRGAEYLTFAGEVFLQLAPAAFDASTLEIWGALLNGSRLVVFPPHAPSLEELGDVLRREGVTTLWLTAGLFHQMVESNLKGLAGVRQLVAGGDALSVAHVRRALQGIPGCTVVNGYGPTEGTTFTCCHPLRGAGPAGATVPIGAPIANTRAYVLDTRGEPTPVGVPGELFAGGDGLARGYLDRPGLTAEKFVPDPFSGVPGARLYRTGDRVRWLVDGTLEFLGRMDHQVKIRGFRIEPGEVEAVLAAVEGVRDCAVVVREDGGDKRLVGYVALDGEQSVEGVKQALRGVLPEYMVPGAFVALDALSLTANGKVDRRALPAPELGAGAGDAYLPPRTATEAVLAEIWAEVLHLERVGVHDNFFELGGHSLLATRVVSRIREAVDEGISLVELFTNPTIESLAGFLAERESQGLASRADEEAFTADSSPQRLLSMLDDLSEEEMDRLLAGPL